MACDTDSGLDLDGRLHQTRSRGRNSYSKPFANTAAPEMARTSSGLSVRSK